MHHPQEGETGSTQRVNDDGLGKAVPGAYFQASTAPLYGRRGSDVPPKEQLMANVVRAALVQATWTGDTESMVAKHEEHAREAARQGAKIIGFQEVFNAPYFCQVQEPEHYRWAEPVPDGPTTRRMQELARETGMVIVVPVFEVEQSGFYYNTAAVIDADGTFLASTASTTSRRSRASGRSTTSSRETSAGPSSTPPSARWESTSATTVTSPRDGGNSV
jgi:hypothetical protein